MNLGLGNRKTLKDSLLAPALRDATDYDATIDAIGLGVAGAFERFCNRTFGRAADATFDCSADRDHVVLPRYPLEDVTKVEILTDAGGVWEALADAIAGRADAAGIVYFNGYLGDYLARIRLTYTGGFWFDTSEDASDTMPAGATPLPPALRLMWLLQCEHVWAQKDKLGKVIAENPKAGPPLLDVKFLPMVEAELAGYRRF